MSDLQYIEQGLFTSFVPVTKDGEVIWAELLSQNEGSNKVLTIHKDKVLRQIRKAGYSVSKAKPVGENEMATILAELEDIL